MEMSVKRLVVVTLLTGLVAFITLLVSAFSSPWIVGDLPSKHEVNVTGSTTRVSNTSGSCREGILVVCCLTHNYTSVSTPPASFESFNVTDDSCSFRNTSGFQGKKRGGYTTCRLFTALTLLQTVAALIAGFLFLCISKLQEKTVVPIAQMALLYTGVFLYMVTLILMGTRYNDFTALLDPKTGWSLYAAIIAELLLVMTGLLSTGVFVLMKRYSSPQYGNFK